MACSKCKKRKAAEAAAAAAAGRAPATPDLLGLRWLVRVDGYEGEFTAADGTRYPLSSGAFYPLLNSDVLSLLKTEAVSFPTEAISEAFKLHNDIS